jgi:hypothetical protein
MNKTTTLTRKLNGLTAMYTHPVIGLPQASLVGHLCANARQLLERKYAEKIGKETFQGMLIGKTEDAIQFAGLVTDPDHRKEILESFGKVWEEAYTGQHLDRLMHAAAGDNAYAGLIAAYGDTAKVSPRTKQTITAAVAVDKSLGIDISLAGAMADRLGAGAGGDTDIRR